MIQVLIVDDHDLVREGIRALLEQDASFQVVGETGDGQVSLRSDPAHKIVNPMLYRFEEVRAIWQQVTAPTLWVDTTETDNLSRLKITPQHHAERRAAFSRLRYVTLPDAGHMLHHDQPERVARLIEDFLREAL